MSQGRGQADRSLFELGFQVQLQEILSRLPTARHSMLFSATLPSSVAEFVRAGLQNPSVIRLDADVKINPDLDTLFLRVNSDDKEAALILLLEHIAIPVNTTPEPDQPQAIIFVATKHHVEYLSALLSAAAFSVSHVYGSLDQIARQRQLQAFRDRRTSLLVVTDVAARGLDIPVMDHVINLDFPPNPRVFVHRVGRTARGGRKGTAWSLLDKDDLPYFADLAQHLATTSVEPELVRLPRGPIETAFESMQALASTATDLLDLRTVMRKGDSMYKRSRSKASSQGYRTARSYADDSLPIFQLANSAPSTAQDASRQSMIDVIASFRPAATSIAVKPKRIGKRAVDPNLAEAAPTGSETILPADEAVAAPRATIVPATKVRGAAVLAHCQDFRDASFYLQHAQKDDGNKMCGTLT